MKTQPSSRLIPIDSIELLRSLLESRRVRSVNYEEAAAIGESLLTFYEILGAEAQENE